MLNIVVSDNFEEMLVDFLPAQSDIDTKDGKTPSRASEEQLNQLLVNGLCNLKEPKNVRKPHDFSRGLAYIPRGVKVLRGGEVYAMAVSGQMTRKL